MEQPSPSHISGEVEIEEPNVDIGGDKPDVEADSKFRIHMQKFGFEKGRADVDVELPSGDVGADVLVEQPSQPHVESDINIAAPGISFESTGGSGKNETKVDGEMDASADVNVDISKGEVSGDVAVHKPAADVEVTVPAREGKKKAKIRFPFKSKSCLLYTSPSPRDS